MLYFPILVTTILLIFSSSSIALPLHPVKRYPFTIIGWTNSAEQIVVAKYLGFEFNPPGIERTKEVMFSTCFPKAMVPVISKYTLVDQIKGSGCPKNFEVTAEYLMEYQDSKGSSVIPVIEPQKGSTWILFLKNNSKSAKKHVFQSVVEIDTFGAESTSANLKLVKAEIEKPSIKK